VLGVAAAHTARNGTLLAGTAGLVAGVMSMAAGEYVSVHSQADTESADSIWNVRNWPRITRENTGS